MKYYPNTTYFKVKISPKKHIIIGLLKPDTYHFYVFKLIEKEEVKGWDTIYSRDKISIISKEFLFSKEMIEVLFNITRTLK